MRWLLTAGLAFTIAGAPGQGHAQGGTDVWVVDVHASGGAITAGRPLNLTRRAGYDNQPGFSADGRTVFFTSVREDAQADIWRIAVTGGAAERQTATPESEYSALVTPDGEHMSVIRVERDSAQRLWRFPLRGDALPSLILHTLQPTGYHLWTGEHTLAAFVLGSPNALVLADLRTGQVDTLSRNIGRALAKIPGREAFTYLQMIRDSTAWITEVDVRTRASARIAPAAPGAGYHVWTPDGVLLSAAGSQILAWSGDRWTVVADFAEFGVEGISRLALSPGGDRLAFVAEDQGEGEAYSARQDARALLRGDPAARPGHLREP